jgi:hypothetical protein
LNYWEGFDWASTPLGPKETWSSALRTTYDIMSSTSFGMCATWGSEKTFLYNEAYAPFLGDRHPWALGQPIDQVWPEVWQDIEPLIARAMAGETVYLQNLHLVMTRKGYAEDTYWTFSYSPLRDGDTIKGFLDVAYETTELLAAQSRDRVNAERVQLALSASAPGSGIFRRTSSALMRPSRIVLVSIRHWVAAAFPWTRSFPRFTRKIAMGSSPPSMMQSNGEGITPTNIAFGVKTAISTGSKRTVVSIAMPMGSRFVFPV